MFARRVGANGEFGVIRLTEFAESTEGDFDDARSQAMLDAGVKAVVLDLRGNGGGVLPTAVAVADRFVDKGVIVRMEGRTPRANRVYEAKPDNTVSDTLPLVVLVDGRSASASEVVAGALQDHRRALLVGERTYGKFLVQQITDVPGHEVGPAADDLALLPAVGPVLSALALERRRAQRNGRRAARRVARRHPARRRRAARRGAARRAPEVPEERGGRAVGRGEAVPRRRRRLGRSAARARASSSSRGSSCSAASAERPR